jgi:hypothetical protein
VYKENKKITARAVIKAKKLNLEQNMFENKCELGFKRSREAWTTLTKGDNKPVIKLLA